MYYRVVMFFSLAAVPSEMIPDAHVDLKKTKTRSAFSSCVRSLRALKETHLLVDDVADMTSASEGCHLAAYNFDMFKSEQKFKENAMDFCLFNRKQLFPFHALTLPNFSSFEFQRMTARSSKT